VGEFDNRVLRGILGHRRAETRELRKLHNAGLRNYSATNVIGGEETMHITLARNVARTREMRNSLLNLVRHFGKKRSF
jgi:hypothetical protein